jgi:hypothetical protein
MTDIIDAGATTASAELDDADRLVNHLFDFLEANETPDDVIYEAFVRFMGFYLSEKPIERRGATTMALVRDLIDEVESFGGRDLRPDCQRLHDAPVEGDKPH